MCFQVFASAKSVVVSATTAVDTITFDDIAAAAAAAVVTAVIF